MVQDFDRSKLSNSYIERLFATNQFDPVRWSGDDPARDALDRGIAKAAVIIPPDFYRRITSNDSSTVQVLVDGTDANNARVIRNSIQATTSFFLQSTGLQQNNNQNQSATSDSTLINQDQSTSGRSDTINNSIRSSSQNQSSQSNTNGIQSFPTTQNFGSAGNPQNQSNTPDSHSIGSQSQLNLGSTDPGSSQLQLNSGNFNSSSRSQTQSSSDTSTSGSQNQTVSSSSIGQVMARVRLWFNPGRKESLYIVPGVYAVVLWIFPSLLSAIAMVREKEKGTILQVYTSSLTAAELLLGKALAYVIVGLCVALIVIGLGSLTFQVGLAGDPTPLLIGTPLYLGVAVMFGLLIGVRSANQNSAVQAVSLVGFLSAFLLSGFIYPLSNIPFPLSLVPNVIPARYFIIVTRDAFVRGIGWVGVWFDVIMIAVLGLFFFNVARRALSRMQLPD